MQRSERADNSFVRDLNDPDGEDDKARVLPDGRSAVLPDGIQLRVTPAGQPTVTDIIHTGDVVSTNYGSGGRVYSVVKYDVYGVDAFSITYLPIQYHHTGHTPTGTVLSYLNEYTAQDGRVLALFANNGDEVKVVKSALVE